MSDYKKTLQLPDTKFPMKANLTQREPETLKQWEQMDAYMAMVESSGQQGTYVLHDGPPYANGHIHIGHALNKILKDIIVKSRNLQGYRAEYVPGWDCHGLPIELKVEQELGEKKKTMPAHAVRKCCRKYASKFIDIQRKEFKRLGLFGAWDKPYMSMQPAYEAATARELGNFAAKGSLVRSKKPIHWCCSCQTALAEAEVEYADHTSHSVFVRFPLQDPRVSDVLGVEPATSYIAIWTTTPWTLPNNMAVAVHPDFEYAVVKHDGTTYVLADGLLEDCAKTFGWEEYEVLKRLSGSALEGLQATHPFYDRPSPIVVADYVTLDTGSGCVHTAPGHGREDYETGLRYGLDIYSPLNNEGRYLESVAFFAGMTVFEANPKIVEKLKEVGNLLAESKIRHSYPHCWRCKNPVIFRATTQWFISMERNDLRGRALKSIREDVRWIPSWGEERIYNMIEQRPDWCISRQRMWGVPIVALLCEDCGEAWNDADWMRDIAERFAKHPTGCDYWYEAELGDIVPEGLKCPKCGASHWKRESDILDVWFDSGTSFAAVVEQRDECTFPADMYLEGSDQHRGWFHSSLLASIGTRGVAPYRSVLTHGYTVDKNGRKMSKSEGNVVAPQEIIDKHGAEVLRLLVSSVDYREDIRVSDEIINRLVDAYRRIRNTCRYLLGNLKGLTLENLVPLEGEGSLDPLDAFALDMVSRAHERIQDAYTEYEFHRVFHALHNLCVTDLSAFYLDILKDRLYSSAEDSHERRSAQTALFHILMMLVRDMAPVLSFTAEEVFRYIPEGLRPAVPTVFALAGTPVQTLTLDDASRARWEKLLAVRSEVTKAIEPLRKSGDIGHSLDTHVTLYADATLSADLASLGSDLRAIFIVSQFSIASLADAPADSYAPEEIADIRIGVAKASGEKCERCWIINENLGSNPEFLGACPRCTAVLAG